MNGVSYGSIIGGRGERGGRRGCPMAHSPRRHRENMPSQRRDLPLGRLPPRDDAAGG